ncbi:TPA: hypothetical protein ACVU5U_004614 [Vibrio parahaemolyticus]|uniref:hypothetical protein n=1 Tax=Vibrio parahaemolyticus TaxID=670 RepID=UPI0011204305|nr:hypothetical protein [Vibrio parahaemolyticus]MBE3775339.1 hypothetical protein [Vibrio parahaemolyticus]MBE4462971.1 hypothetical protein [Vibrio parahaemolyticus]MDN4706343.1 hypothetical protein [Vibrio parahaemolyticus]MDN4714255.1 hypothetical protein [Vibrio parahaemolyticus]MDN4718126.1 hypothetical protein [Vibrio parahaemolyticus]
MNLKDFVSESILEIIEGVQDAQKRIESDDAKVAPHIEQIFSQSQTGGTNLAIGWDSTNNLVHSIEFDVAVTTSEGTNTKGGIGVVAGVFSLGAQGASSDNYQSISRLKFRVPVSFPRNELIK